MLPGNEKFKYEQTVKNGLKTVVLIGDIDEDTHLDPLAKLTGPLVFNFSQVQSINSLGVRSWVNLVKELAGQKISYAECPPVIVRQMNMVPSFMGHADVHSVYVPFVCDQCDTEKLFLVNRENFAGLGNLGAAPCDSCGKGEMELDGHPQQYVAFDKAGK